MLNFQIPTYGRAATMTLAVVALLGAASIPASLSGSRYAHARQGNCQTFPETGKSVCGRFLEYWTQNGGLAQQGFPISGEMQERSDSDGKTYNVQYFERAVFEAHPENQAPNDVLLSLLGVFYYRQKHSADSPGGTPNTSSGSRLFPETGKRLGGVFLDYWQRNGGLRQQGLPVSDEIMERSDLDGKPYKVQYFERAVFEHHPENPPPYDVLLSQLGTFRYRQKYATGAPTHTPVVHRDCIPTRSAGPTTMPRPTAPERTSVGQGHVLTGFVRGAPNCTPIAGARIVFWLTDPQGQYDDAHRATVVTGGDGSYRFESNYPGAYESAPPHIHYYVIANGYKDQVWEYLPPRGSTQGSLDLVLEPESSTP